MADTDQFLLAPAIQQLFRDKDSNLPLTAGEVTFYEDKSRTTLKSVYKITGPSGGPYTYVALANPVILNSAGAFDDAIYYKPFNDAGDPDPYFIEVRNSVGVLQLTRENYPDVEASGGQDEQNEVNYISNGQFLEHVDIPADDTVLPPLAAGQIRKPLTEIAYGGWFFVRPSGSDNTDFVTFDRFGGFTTNPDKSPRYACRFVNTLRPTVDLFKDITKRYSDVNKFSSDIDMFTFQMEAASNTGGDVTVDLLLIKNYGVGGSPQEEIPLTTFSVMPSYNKYNFSFAFGSNATKTIGTQDDDFVEIVLRFPRDSASDVSFTDVLQIDGTVESPLYPYETDRQMLSQAIGGSTPVSDPLGFDLYLPLVLGPRGLIYDQSPVGKVMMSSISHTHADFPAPGELEVDGAKYETAKYSTDGIPYKRLQAKYFDTTLKSPLHGTGLDYFTSQIFTPTDTLVISNNSKGVVANAADGAVPTGFTFVTSHKANVDVRYAEAYVDYTDKLLLINDFAGQTVNSDLPAQLINNSGATVEIWQPGSNGSFGIVGFVSARQVSSINFPAAIAASQHWTFETIVTRAPGVAAVDKSYYVWYAVNGAGVDPGFGGKIGIKVDLLSTFTAFERVALTKLAIDNVQATTIKTVAAAPALQGAYFDINATGNDFRVWFTVDGTGTAPSFAGKVEIKVELATGDTAAQVADKLHEAVNSKFYQVPDIRDKTIKVFNATPDDPSHIVRYSKNAVFSKHVGTDHGWWGVPNDFVDQVPKYGQNQSLPYNSQRWHRSYDSWGRGEEPPTTAEPNYSRMDFPQKDFYLNMIVKY